MVNLNGRGAAGETEDLSHFPVSQILLQKP